MTGPGSSAWPVPPDLVARLAGAGCVAAEEEAVELVAAASGDAELLAHLVERRTAGQPLAWVTGEVTFLGRRIGVRPGVYVPRGQTQVLAARAITLVPPHGIAVDLCTGSGAIAAVMGDACPGARVVASELDPAACACAAGNGVEVYLGHLADPLPSWLRGQVDVVVAVAPYVPTTAIPFLPRDAREHEPRLALDGGPKGTEVLEAVVHAAAGLLRPAATLLLELGADQDVLLRPALDRAGFGASRRHWDVDGDLRGIEVVLGADDQPPPPPGPGATSARCPTMEAVPWCTSLPSAQQLPMR